MQLSLATVKPFLYTFAPRGEKRDGEGTVGMSHFTDERDPLRPDLLIHLRLLLQVSLSELSDAWDELRRLPPNITMNF